MDEVSLLAIIKLAEEENDCTGVVDAMREGASSAVVAKAGCSALTRLTVDVDNRKRIGEAGGIAMILSTMEKHGASSAEVAQYGCAALSTLAVNDDNRVTIAGAGGVRSVMDAMEHHKDVALVQQFGCNALSDLAQNGKKNIYIESIR